MSQVTVPQPTPGLGAGRAAELGELLGDLAEQPGCPKRMVFGPCGGVRPDERCEMGDYPCVFLQIPARTWPLGDATPFSRPGFLDASPRPVVLTDCTLAPYDRASIIEIVGILSGACDALLLGEHHNRPDFPPTALAGMVQDAGGSAVVTLTCRDRNRLVLEQELHGLADLGVAGVLCVTGDGRAHGVRPGVTQVFDVDGTRLAALARDVGVPVLVPESPQSPPREQRAARVFTKQQAGAGVCVLNHVSSAAEVAAFVRACRTIGVTIPFIPAVAAFTDSRSAEVLQRFPGLTLDPVAVRQVLDSPDPVTAGIDAAVTEARELLDIDGVVGVNISGLASAAGLVHAARIKAAIGEAVRQA